MKKIPILILVLGLLICASFAQTSNEIKTKISKIRKEITRLKTKIPRVSQAKRLEIQDLIEGHEARLEKLNQELKAGKAAAPTDQRSEQIKTKISKIRKEITRLKARMKKVPQAKRLTIQGMIDDHEANLKNLEKEPAVEEEAVEAETLPAEEEVVPEELPEETEELPEETGIDDGKRFRFKIGGTAGLFSASTSAFGEIRFSLPFIFGPATTSLRLAGGLAQSDDTSRRYVPIMVDWIFNLPAGWFTGVENYVGLGLNYVVLTSGWVPGSVGGQVCYGVQSKGFGGQLFGEMGYGILRTGFTPAHKGATVLFGYRRDWAF